MREFKCLDCGDTDPNNFYKGSKSYCKVCKSKKYYKYQKKVKSEYYIKYSYKLPQTNKKLTNEEFIANVEKAYPNKYSFELTNYINHRTDVTVTCIKHNHNITTSPQNLSRSKFINESVGSCQICMDEYTGNIKSNIFDRITNSHNGIYKYDFNTYSTINKEMSAICQKHGEFKIIPRDHIKGYCLCPKCIGCYNIENKRYIWCDIHKDVSVGKNRSFKKGCPICNDNNNKYNGNERLIKALNNKTSNKYDIKIIDNNVHFYCKEHDKSFIYNKNNIYSKKFYCDDCYDKVIQNNNSILIDKINKTISEHYSKLFEFVELLPNNEIKLLNKLNNTPVIVHQDRILYKIITNDLEYQYRKSFEKVSYDEAKKIVNNANITSWDEYKFWRVNTKQFNLPAHPNRVYKEFTNYYDFFDTNDLKYQSMSLGERKIFDFLINKNIKFISEKTFPDCRDKGLLRFDFYLPIYNIVIEFDGKQHHEETDYFQSSLEEIQYRDNIKNEYCIKNNIFMIRLKYTELIQQTIEKTLENILLDIDYYNYKKYYGIE